MSQKKKHPAPTKKRRERMRRALEYREQGAQYSQIAEKLGISKTMAYNDVQDALREITREPSEAVLKLELQRIDRLWLGLYAKAIKGDVRCVDRAIKLIDRRITLHGLNVQQHDISVEVLEALGAGFQVLDEMDIQPLDSGE